jgi:hypothetical protein
MGEKHETCKQCLVGADKLKGFEVRHLPASADTSHKCIVGRPPACTYTHKLGAVDWALTLLLVACPSPTV